MTVRRIILIRHCATDAGGGRLVGATDVEAAQAGLAEVSRLGEVFARFSPEVWYCSPLLRARQSADRLKQHYGIAKEFVIDERLREIDFGRWEMKTFAEIQAADPELVEKWRNFAGFVFPQGEAVASFTARISDVLASLQRETAGQVGIVTHGGVIRSMICQALGLGDEKYLLFDVRPCRAAVIDLYPEGGVLTALNV